MAATILSLLALTAICRSAYAQSSTQPLPPLVVQSPPAKTAPKAAAPKASPTPAMKATPAATPAVDPALPLPGGSLTVPTTIQAQAILAKVPGTVVVVPDTAFKYTTPAVTIKDVLDYVPGVIAQPKWGDDTRLSIRGSGLSRNFHLRGVATNRAAYRRLR